MHRTAARPLTSARPVLRLLLAVSLGLALALALAGAARADGTPAITLSNGAQASVLHGSDVAVSLTAANPDAAYGYNLAFRYVLPAGVSYVKGSESTQAGEPRVLADSPDEGETTLIWPNVDDLSPGSSRTISFQLSYDPAVYDVGSSFPTEAGAYISTEPRDEADFNADGTPGAEGPGSYTGSASADATTQITAIQVRKSEPHPEGEIPRGVHDQQTIYTLKVTNNHVNPTNAVKLEDYLPAGLEFLGCAGTPDHTTDAPTNPGYAEEYPDSGPIVVGAVPDCIQPDLVETVELDPDGDGPLEDGVYTHVVWNDIGDFAPNQVKEVRYRAAIPLRENTMEWSGAEPGTAGAQAANLDNNSGRETYDEQPLRNGAIVTGTYQAPEKDGLEVSDEGTLLRTAEDLAIQKSNNKPVLEQGDLTKWTIDLQVSEYRFLEDVTIRDTVPSGLCPLGPENYTHPPRQASDDQCDADAGHSPSQAYASVDEQPNGTFAVNWDSSSFPALAHLSPNATEQITFWTKTRTNYQSNFEDAGPILSRDAVSNEIDTEGASYVRCEGGNPNCTSPAPGHKIDSDWTDGNPVLDHSGSGKEASGPVLEKTVAAQLPASKDCGDLETAAYGKTVPAYGPGDKVCWKLRIAFPGLLDTHTFDVYDLLPHGISYIDGSWQETDDNTVEITHFGNQDGRLNWTIDSGNVDAGGLVFEVTIASEVGSPLGHRSGDVEGNLEKFSYQNTKGTTFPLRDRVDFTLALPELALVKGVWNINGAGNFAANTDHKQVRGGDLVQYRVDISNGGKADASSSRVWDVLPTGIGCADVDAKSISDGGACVGGGGGDRIEWSGIALAAGASKTLSYSLTVPTDVSPDQKFVNTAGVVEYTYATNQGEEYALVPDNPTVKDPGAGTPNTRKAEDPSDVYTPDATIAKARTTSVTEGGNKDGQATIGETVEYTVTTKIPGGTTVYDAAVTDALGSARQAFVEGSLSGTLDGNPLPSAGVSASYDAGTIAASFPHEFTALPGGSVLILKFSAKVLDVDANTRSKTLPNKAVLTFKDQLDRPKSHESSVSTTIVEPKIAAAKSDDANPDRVKPGDVVNFTVKASNSSGSNVSTAHEVTVVDTIPLGTTPIDSGGNPIANGAAAGPEGGVWNAAARTITWTQATTPALAAIAPGGSVNLTYEVRVDDPATSGANLTNTVDEQAKSLDDSVGDVRTSAATASTHGDYAATAEDTLKLQLAAITKSVSPDPITIGNDVVWHVRVTVPKDLRLFDATVLDTVPDGFEVDSYGSATCLSGCLGSDPTVLTFPAAVQGNGTTAVAWFLGDLEPSGEDRVYDLPLLGHLRDTYRNGGARVLDGNKLTNEALVASNRTDKVGPSPTSPPSGFDDKTAPAKAESKVVEPKLAIAKSASAGPKVQPGQPLTYTVKVTNNGHSPAYDLVVGDEPDSELTDIVLQQGAGLATRVPSAGDHRIEWTIPGPLAPGDSVTFTYDAKVVGGGSLSNGQTIDNTAAIDEYFGVPKTVRQAHPGYVYRRYTGPTSSVQLRAELPALALVKTTGASGNPDQADAEIGVPFKWRVSVTNTASVATAFGVDVTDTLPPNWAYVPGSTHFSGGGGADPSVSPNAGGDVLSWSDVANLAPGQTLVVEFEAKPLLASGANPGHGSGHPHINSAVSTASDSSGSPTSADGPYTSNTDTAKAVLHIPDLGIVKTPDNGEAVAGTASSFTIKVTNTGEATAHGVVVDDVLPSGLQYTPGTATASPSAGFSETGPLHWKIVSIAPGATVTITLPVFVEASVPDGTTLVNRATTYADDVPTPHEDDGSLRVKAKADVAVTKADDHDPVIAGTNLGYTIVVRNNGPSDAQNVVLTDTLPSPDLSFVSVDPPCSHTGNAISCEFGTLEPGATRTVNVLAKVSPDQLATIHNTAKVTTTTTDTNPGNNEDTEPTDVVTKADVSIAKSADRSHYNGGETITYTLEVRNDGPSTARAVTARDPLPAEVDFVSVSPGSPTCTQAAGTVECGLGDLKPGQTRTITIVTKAKGQPPLSGEGHHEHQITVAKEERYLSLAPGQTVSSDLSCGNGGEMVDGSAHIVDVDQGNSLADVQVLEADSVALGTYRFVVRNDTPGQAQGRVTGVCLPPQTEGESGHSHGIVVGAPIYSSSAPLAPGTYEFHLATPLGFRAVAPGLKVASGSARLIRSEDDGHGGWNFKVEVLKPNTSVSVSVRPLKETTAVANGHTHDLLFEHPAVRLTLAPGEVRRQVRVGCGVGYKGIVATYDLPPGVIMLGSEPEPINRDFDVYNTTDHAVEIELDLVCMRITTGSEIDPLDPVVNTATVASTTEDPNLGNNSSAAGITISRQQDSSEASSDGDSAGSLSSSAGASAPAGRSASPAGRTSAPALRLGTSTLNRAATAASVRVGCATTGACAGTVTLTVPVAGKQLQVGSRAYRVRAQRWKTLRVKVKPRFRKLVRRKGWVKATARSADGGRAVVSRIRLKG